MVELLTIHCMVVAGFLTGHPARKYVIEFLRTIVIDSMSQPVVAKSASVIDIMLEVGCKVIVNFHV